MLPRSDASYSSSWPVTGSLSYPKAEINANTDWVKITFYEYKAPYSTQVIEANSDSTSISSYNTSANAGLNRQGPEIRLYMPEDVGAKYGANWGDKNISNFGRAVLRAGGQAMGQAFTPGGITGAILKPIQEITQGMGEAAGNFMTKGTGTIKAIQETLSKTNFDPSLSFDDVLGGITGQILNPNTEVLYTGPQMRGFGLSFKMAPRNAAEAEEIKNIITAFKYAILPKFNGDKSQVRAFVGVPNIVDVSFMKGSSEHPFVTQYKPCAITGFDVSYTPDGAWATLPNGSPVATTIGIEFKELKMLYAEEISQSGGSY